jgi:hypothetical protein
MGKIVYKSLKATRKYSSTNKRIEKRCSILKFLKNKNNFRSRNTYLIKTIKDSIRYVQPIGYKIYNNTEF